MKDKDKFLTVMTISIACFINLWAVICGAAAFFTWLFLDKQKARNDAEMASVKKESESNLSEEEVDTILKGTDSTETVKDTIDLTNIRPENDPFLRENQADWPTHRSETTA